MIDTYNIILEDKIISELKDYFNDENKINIDFSLNKNKTCFDTLEQMINFIVKYIINKLNITSDYFIEFCLFKDNSPNVKKYNLKNTGSNILSSFIIYLTTNNDYPTIITNIDKEKYKFKDFNDEIELCYLFPKELKVISIPENLVVIDNSNSYRIHINILNKKKLTENFYVSKDNLLSTINLNLKKIDCNIKHMSFGNEYDNDFFEDLLYSNYSKSNLNLLELIKKSNYYPNNDIFLFKKETIKNLEYTLNEKNINCLLEPKFLCHYFSKEYYNFHFCEWIKMEYENYLLQNKIIETKQINLKNINSILSFNLISSINIIDSIREYYTINDSKFNIKDIFITNNYNFVNYEETIIVNIILNNSIKNEKQFIHFDNGIKVNLKQGDMIIYNGTQDFKMTDNMLVLVFHINIYNNL